MEEEVEFQGHAIGCRLQLPYHQLHAGVHLRTVGNEALHIAAVERHVHLRCGKVLGGAIALFLKFLRRLLRHGGNAVEVEEHAPRHTPSVSL